MKKLLVKSDQNNVMMFLARYSAPESIGKSRGVNNDYTDDFASTGPRFSLYVKWEQSKRCDSNAVEFIFLALRASNIRRGVCAVKRIMSTDTFVILISSH